MNLYKSNTYSADLRNAITDVLNLEKLKNQTIMITGATGLIGSFLIDMLLTYNKNANACIKIYAIGRSIQRLKKRFAGAESDFLIYVEHDVNNEPLFDFSVDYIIHAASNAYPASFNSDPVGTIMSNVLGTEKLLNYGMTHNMKRFLFVSSGEIYGQGDISIDSLEESYSGYVDPTQPRSCYPASKRTAETLCVAYAKQFGLDTIIVRPCHTYGPNATSVDNRANVQFVNNVLNNEDIILKSAGNQLRSYCYIADTASALLTVLLNGLCCNAYNIANSKATATIAEYAGIVAEKSGHKLIFENPDAVALAERSPIAKQVLNTKKLASLGWQGRYSVSEGIAHTLSILTEIK